MFWFLSNNKKAHMMYRPFLSSGSPMYRSANFLIRLMAGSVFLSEGVQKFLFPDALGVGRFIKIGIPFPAFTAPFVGIVEIICGLLFLAGLFTQLAAVPLIIDMLVAIATTKIPFFLQHGFWAAAHEARVDWCMLLASIFLLIEGAGEWSLDALMVKKQMGAGQTFGRVQT